VVSEERMRRLWGTCLVVLLSSVVFAGAKSNQAGTAHKTAPRRLPVTTSSLKARKHFERAMENLENMRLDDSLQDLRTATKVDPKFAQALMLLSYLSHDPGEQQATRIRAKQLAMRTTHGERSLIRWLAGVQEDNYVPAIAAMNDLLAQYPGDERLAFLAGGWLVRQERYTQAVVVLERGLALNPNYAATLNELGYGYAFCGDFTKGFAAMERYVALQPDQPNPHDSYGEILRLAGKFDAALEQYRMSIRIDPNFGSELGVADTYAVMGKEEEARDEYERAIVFVSSESDKVEYELQSAVTWIREDNRKQAERSLREVARHAHAAGLARLEAESHRVLAMYDPDYKTALKELQAAQNALQERHQISRSDRDEEQARILRVRATRAAEAGAMDSASGTVKQLESMAQNSHSQVIQLSYHAAAGAVLMTQGKSAEAIPHVEEDSADPLSMRLLWLAYSKTGAAEQAGALAAKLAALNVPTVEQALVVPQFRAGLVSQVRQP
jgi:tetratricopeptide (TPR) repeat protein